MTDDDAKQTLDVLAGRVAEVVVRSQKSKHRYRAIFGGPDCYVVAVVRDAGGEPVGYHPLSRHNIERYGWEVHYCGAGYSAYDGPRSQLGRAYAKADAIVRAMR